MRARETSPVWTELKSAADAATAAAEEEVADPPLELCHKADNPHSRQQKLEKQKRRSPD